MIVKRSSETNVEGNLPKLKTVVSKSFDVEKLMPTLLTPEVIEELDTEKLLPAILDEDVL